MSAATPKIFEALCLGFNNPFPPEPKDPNDWVEIKIGRPCFSKMLSSPRIETNSRPDLVIFAIARELWRRGYNYFAIEKEILRFNEHSLRPIMPRRRAIQAMCGYDKKEFFHCCSHELLTEFCVGHDNCGWLKWVVKNERKTPADIEKFESMYSSLLRTDVKRVYRYFLDIEEQHHLHAGQRIFRSYRQITHNLNLPDKGIVQRACKKLQELGLIEIVFGGRSGFDSTLCTGFRRVSPIPAPSLPRKDNRNV